MAGCVEEVEGAIAKVVVGFEVSNLEVVGEGDLSDVAGCEVGIQEDGVGVSRVAGYEVILEAWADNYLGLGWVFFWRSMMVASSSSRSIPASCTIS
jgi:hypothetical protein